MRYSKDPLARDMCIGFMAELEEREKAILDSIGTIKRDLKEELMLLLEEDTQTSFTDMSEQDAQTLSYLTGLEEAKSNFLTEC